MAADPNFFSVVDYGADPKHSFDSTNAFKAAFCAAILARGGTVIIPPGEYIVTETIPVYCLEQFGVNVIGASGSGIKGSPVGSTIDYQGPDGTACFAIQGMNYSYWRGFGINLGGNGTAANQIAIDLQVGQNNVPVLNQGNNVLESIVVNIQGTGGGHIGIRLGQYNDNTPPYGDQGSNISGTTLRQITINGDYQGSGHAPSTSIGVQFGGGQVKPNRVMFCAVGGLGCDYLVGSIGSLLSSDVSATQPSLPVYDVTLFKPNGSNTRYAVIGLSEICSYTGVTTNAAYAQTAPSLSLTNGSSDGNAVYVVLTYVDTSGETTASPQSTLTPPKTQTVQVASPAASGQATGYNVYAGSASGGPYHLQNTTPNPIAEGTYYSLQYPLDTSSRQPPVLNTTGQGAPGGAWGGTLTGVTRGVLGTAAKPWSGGPGIYTTVIEYQPNVGVYSGSDDIIWVECGGGSSLRNFFLQTGGGTCFAILGGRWEALLGIGQRFLQTGYNISELSQSITVKSVQLGGFTPPFDAPAGGSNGVIWLVNDVNLEWTGGSAIPQTGSYADGIPPNKGTNGYFLTNNSYSGHYGAVNFRNFIIAASTSPLPWLITYNWPVNADLLLANSSLQSTGRYRQIQMAGGQIQTAIQETLATLGFFGATPVGQQTMGAATAGGTYTSNEQNMLQTLWNVLRAFGLGN